MHLNIRQIGELCREDNPGAIVLVHFYPEMEAKTPDQIQDFLKSYYNGPIYPGEDGITYRWDEERSMWVIHKLF
jgi:ribonuclease BN (tRNA processing enzyme)